MNDNPFVMNEPDLIDIRNFMYITFSKIKNCRFKGVEDIELDTLREFLYKAMLSYKKNEISSIDLINITDSLETYMHRRYMNNYPETLYPSFPLSHPLSIGLEVIQYIHDIKVYASFNKDVVEKLISYLQTTPGREQEANIAMEKFYNKLKLNKIIKKQ